MSPISKNRDKQEMRCSFTVQRYISTNDFPAHVTLNEEERKDNKEALQWKMIF